MKANITVNNQTIKVDLDQPLDISIPVSSSGNNLTAWYQNQPTIKPVCEEGFVGSVEQGGSVNFNNISFNPHAHCTHTECVGHITKEVHSINKSLKKYFSIAKLITINPIKKNEDKVITLDQVKTFFDDGLNDNIKSLIVRTQPNTESKKHFQYSNTNPIYLESDIADYIIEKGINHLLVDLPSVDKEVDSGALAFHNAFWECPKKTNTERTITELIYVPNNISDGYYLMSLQVAPFENDASPSRPVLYAFS